MKYNITCCECGEEHSVFCGTGKAAEKQYNRIKDSWTCEACQDKWFAEKTKRENEDKLANGWKEITVHYSVYKNEIEGAVNVRGEKAIKLEYHPETKSIDLIVPEGKLVKLNREERDLLKRDYALILSETEEEFQAKKAALLARFEEEKPEEEETVEEPEVVEEDVAEAADDDYEPEAAEDFEEQIEWECLKVNKCYVEKMTEKGVLVRMPNGSDYAGYKFWHPRKCFKHTQYCWEDEYEMYFKDDWKFTLKANGGALIVELEGSSLNDSLPANGFEGYEEIDEKHVPLPMEPVEIEADEELVDDED